MEREAQDEILIDLPELLALYLRKGFWIIGISILFALLFTGFRMIRKTRGRRKNGSAEILCSSS